MPTRAASSTTSQTASDAGGLPGARKVRKAYEQVYDQLREMVLSGEIRQGQRLPKEASLTQQFGVSRSTVREALRLLAAENLVRTTEGSAGGTFVTLPTVDHVQQFLTRNIELLTQTENVTLEEFLDARQLIEVFAVRQAALRRTADDIAALRATIPPADTGLSPADRYLHNKEFHSVLVDACGNTLLTLAAQPIFSVLNTHLARSRLSATFPRKVCADHGRILQAIEAGDADAAVERMRTHLADLAVVYRSIWRESVSGDA